MYSSEDCVPRRRRTASFSSSLLDAIYRSIDDSSSDHRQQERQTTPMKKKQSNTNNYDSVSSHNNQEKELDNLRRAIMIESWVEKQSVGQISMLSNSASSSSESIWSSSETESRPKPKPKPEPEPKPKPEKQRVLCPDKKQTQSPKPFNGFSMTKLKATKIYGELKKVKQPISPGGRIASFFTSIFSPGNVKKAKMCYVGAVEDVTMASASASVSASKIKARSSSRAKKGCIDNNNSSNNNDKRSVRFYPVSVIVGEDSKPCGRRRVYDDDGGDQEEGINDPCLMPLSDIRSFVKKTKSSYSKGSFCDDHDNGADEEDDYDDDGDESYSSSDLFEIDHLVGVGLRYREELPVYETTSLKTNQAIASGLIF